MATEETKKRPRAKNARPKIERAALKLFVADGVDASTTREIAEVAGVSEGALYRHYKGKDELAIALFMETHNRLGKTLVEAWSQGGDLEDKVRRAVTAYCALADEDWLLFSFHLLSMNRFLPHDKRREDDPLTLAENIVKGLIAEKEIPDCDPALMAGMMFGIVFQCAQNKAYNRLPGPFSAHIEPFTRAIVAVLRQE